MERINHHDLSIDIESYKFDKKEDEFLGNGSYGYIVSNKYRDKEVILKYSYLHNSILKFTISKEINTCSILNGHPYIVNTLGYIYKKNINNDLCFDDVIIVQEKLNKLYRSSDLKIKKRWILQVAVALEFIHMNNIIHCDIGFTNIMLDNSNIPNIKIIDFGNSIHFNETLNHNSTITTYCFASPECLINYHNIDNKLDVWSLGMFILYLFYNKILSEACTINIDGQCSKHQIMNEIFKLINEVKKKDVDIILKNMSELKKLPEEFNQLYDLIFDDDFNGHSYRDKLNLYDLLINIFTLNKDERPTISQVISHKYFDDSYLKDVHDIRSKHNYNRKLRSIFSICSNKEIRQEIILYVNYMINSISTEYDLHKKLKNSSLFTINNDVIQFIILVNENAKVIERFYEISKMSIRVLVRMIYITLVLKINEITSSTIGINSYKEMYRLYTDGDHSDLIDERILYYFQRSLLLDRYSFSIKPYIPFCSSRNKADLDDCMKIVKYLCYSPPNTKIDLIKLEKKYIDLR